MIGVWYVIGTQWTREQVNLSGNEFVNERAKVYVGTICFLLGKVTHLVACWFRTYFVHPEACHETLLEVTFQHYICV